MHLPCCFGIRFCSVESFFLMVHIIVSDSLMSLNFPSSSGWNSRSVPSSMPWRSAI